MNLWLLLGSPEVWSIAVLGGCWTLLVYLLTRQFFLVGVALQLKERENSIKAWADVVQKNHDANIEAALGEGFRGSSIGSGKKFLGPN